MYNSGDGSSKSVELHLDNHVSHVTLHAAAHATVADLVSTAISASSSTAAASAPASALTPRVLARQYDCTDTSGNRITLDTLASAAPASLVVTESGNSGTAVGGGSGGSASSAAVSAVAAPVGGRSRGRGRGRGRSRGGVASSGPTGGSGHRRGGTAAAKARTSKGEVEGGADEENDEDGQEGEEEEEEEVVTGIGSSGSDREGENDSSAAFTVSDDDSEDASSNEEGSSENADADDYSGNAEEEEDAKAEGESDGETSSATASTIATTRLRRGGRRRSAAAASTTTAATGAGRGRGRGRGRGGSRGSTRGSSTSTTSLASTATTAAASPAVTAEPKPTRRSSRTPLLFTPDGIPIKRKRGRPPKSQQIAFAAAVAAAAAAAASGGGGAPLTADKTARKTRRSAKTEAVLVAEEVKPRRGGRRRRSDVEAETPAAANNAPASTAATAMTDGAPAVSITGLDDASVSAVSARGRRGAAAAVAVMGEAVTMKRSRSPSSSPHATPTTAAAPSSVGGDAEDRTWKTARAGPGAVTMSTTRARNVAALEQQQQRLQRLPEEEQQEQVPHAQRRPVRLTYNVYYPAAAITPVPASTEARDEKAKTGGSSSSGALASTAAASSASCFLNSDSTPARPRYAWNSLPVALADHPHLQSSLFELLRSVSSYVAAAAAASATAAASASAETTAELVPAIKAALSETGDAAQLCRQAQLTVAAWRAGFHRTPSLLLSHPYGPWVLPGMRVYRSPAATLECWRRLKANSGGSSLKGEGSSVKQEVDDGNDDAGPASVNATGSNHAAKSGERHRLSPSSSSPPFDWCYPNQSLIIPLVVGGCVQLVNPESKDKSHQWTVYVRGLWNGHPEEVANPNPLSPSSPSLAQHDGLPTGVSAGLLSESQTSTLSTSAAAPNDYLSDFIEKVVFVLDESFVPCVRVVHSAPFELTEVGWGEFIVSIHVHLKVPGQTVQARHVQDQLLQYYCGFNGRTIMQTTDGRGTKPHDPVSTFITGGVRGPNNLWTALATPLPTTSGTIPPTPARPLSELRHQLQYDSLLDINSNSGARMMYYRSPYLPLHLVTCDSTSASESSSSSSSSNSDSNSNKDESDGEADGDAENNGRGFSNAVDASSQDDGNATRCVAGGERGGGGGASVGSNGGEGLIGGGMSQADSENEESRRASPAHQVVTTATSSTSPFPAKPATPTNVSTSSSCSGCKTPSVASLDWTGGGGGCCASAAAITTGTGSSSDSGTVDHVARAADGGVGVGGGEEVRVVASEMNHRAGYAGRGHRSNTVATTSSDSSHASRSPRRGPGRRPHRFGVSARAAATSKETAAASAAGSGGRGSTPGSPTGAGGVAAGGAAGAKKPFAEVHVGHGGNVVVLQHLLRFSHRPRYPAAIPPARDPRTQGPRPELLGYTMVAEPVVTEQYDELVLPLEAFGDVTALQEKEAVAANTGASCTTAAGGRTTSAAAACANLRRVVEAASKLEGHLRATLRRQLSLDLNTPSSAVSAEQQPSASMPPLTNVEAQTLGHPGGISSWPQVLDYGNGIERDTAYTAAFLSSAARSAEEEGWLALSLQDTRQELFGVAAAAASPRCMYACATPMSASEEVQEHGKAENVTRHAARFSPRVKAEGNDGGAAVQRGDEAGWVTAFEYDLASVLMRLPSVTAHDVFFDLLLPRAEEIGTAVWADLCRGIATLCITPPLPQPSAGSSTVSAAGAAATAVKNEPVWATSALQESEDEEGKAIDKNSTEACVWQNTVTSALRSSPVHLSHAYPLCSLRSTDTGIAVLRSLALVSTASGSAHGTSSPPVQAAPSSSTSNTSAISATSVNSLFASSLGSTNVASQAGLLNTGGTVAPPTVATATTHHPSHASGGGGSSSGYAHQESLMASMLRDGQTRGSFGHDGDVKQLLSWRAALETSIAAMRVEVARRQAAAVLEEL